MSVKRYLRSFDNHAAYEAYINGSNAILPNVSYCKQEDEVHYKNVFQSRYLTTTALENGTISFNISQYVDTDMITSISYSTDNGNNWTATQNQDSKSADIVITVNVNKGDRILWKGIGTQTGCYKNYYINYSSFASTAKFNVEGNVMSLIYGDNFMGENTSEYEYQFHGLFKTNGSIQAKVVNAKNFILPATTLASDCYSNMFRDCTSLTTAPELPATTLAQYCYSGMFYGCTSLATAPELNATTLTSGCYERMFQGCTSLTTAPALNATTLTGYCYQYMFQGCTSLRTAPELSGTTLASYCYYQMFQGCTSLRTTPELPATILATFCYSNMFDGCTSLTTAPDELSATTLDTYCYQSMFSGCTSLTTAPALPATTLASDCYSNMFYGCTSLTTAPELPATTLVTRCYGNMFNGCTSLNYIKAMFTTTPSTSYTSSWVSGVASTGTFVKNASASWTTTGVNGIPEGWAVETASA